MNKLLQLLRALSREQLRALDKFMRSPYHVTHAGVLELYEYLRAEMNRPEAQVSREAADRNIRRRRSQDPRHLYHLHSYLQENIEYFLSLELWEEEVHERHIGTVDALRRLHLPEQSAAMLRYARKRLEQDPRRGHRYHYADYRLHLEAFRLSQQQGRAKNFNLQELSEAQDLAFIAEKLRTGCMLLSHQAVAQTVYDKGLLDSILQYLENHRFLEIPAVAVYYHGYYAQLGRDGAYHFGQLKTILERKAQLFSSAEIHDLYLMAINFCIRRINQSDEQYFRELLDLYRSGLVHGALLEGGLLSRWTYTNITGVALRLREYTWLHDFLHQYAEKLDANHREGAFHFNMARYHYDTGALAEAMQHLLRMEYDDIHQNLLAKTLLSKIYFELGELDALENQLDNIQIYLRRTKVPAPHRNIYSATVRYLRKLAVLNPYDTEKKNRLRTEIEQSPNLNEREWFLKQL